MLERKMAVAPTDQMSRLQAEIQNLQAQLQTRPLVTKDLSLVAMVPKWSGTVKAVPLHDFFEILEILQVLEIECKITSSG
jgi:hypothetical protein